MAYLRRARSYDATRPLPPYTVNWDSWQAQGLAAWYPLHSNSKAIDFIGKLHLPVSGTSAMYADRLYGLVPSNQSLWAYDLATPVLTAPPCTLAAWCRHDNSLTGTIASICNTTQADERISIVNNGSHAVLATASVATVGTATTTTNGTINVWQHACGVFRSITDRSAYLNAGSRGDNATSKAPVPNSTTIGGLHTSGGIVSTYFGLIADVRYYTRALTDPEIAALYDPSTRWDLYYPLGRRTYFMVPVAALATAALGATHGLLRARRFMQYLPLASPLTTIPDAVPGYTRGELPMPTRRPVALGGLLQSPAIGQADLPLPTAEPPVPLRRRGLLTGVSHSPGIEQADSLPSLAVPLPIRRPFSLVGLTQSPAIGQADVAPPVVPTQTGLLPPQAPRARRSVAQMPLPVGPPSSALLPPGTVDWASMPEQPIRELPRRPQPLVRVQNILPIPPTDPPLGSWSAKAEIPVLRRRFVGLWQTHAAPLDPITTPAYLSSFWNGYAPPGPFPKRGLLAALQQAYAEAPLASVVVITLAPWRPSYPDFLRRFLRLPVYLASSQIQDLLTLSEAVDCILLTHPAVRETTLADADVRESTLASGWVRETTLSDPEVC